MITVIDRLGDDVLQKITTPKGEVVGYQVGKPGLAMERVGTLTAARVLLGKIIVHPQKNTVPKSEYPHNQTGYRADIAGKRK